MGAGHEAGERLHVAEERVDAAVVGDVVAAVLHRGRVEGADPERVDAERLEVAEAPGDAVEVAGAVAVGVLEGARVDLVEDAGLPPRAV